MICAPIGSKPLIQPVRNGLACEHLATVEVGGEGEIGRPAGLQFTVEDRNVGFIRTCYQRNGLLIPVDVDGGISPARERSSDIHQRLPQAIAGLLTASSRPEGFGKQFPAMATAACKRQGSKKK
ncbi:hypothetical protein LZK76_15805 [Rhizobium leguminosarum]|nr:hypothetical protein LZK76_15805 [Rhizobium leguminosarum]